MTRTEKITPQNKDSNPIDILNSLGFQYELINSNPLKIRVPNDNGLYVKQKIGNVFRITITTTDQFTYFEIKNKN